LFQIMKRLGDIYALYMGTKRLAEF
jgi:hypothetical protein